MPMKQKRPTYAELLEDIRFLKEQTKILVIDLEATCTEDPDLKKTFKSEIIEFGISLFSPKTPSYEAHQIYVTPVKSPVTDFCTQLTGISWETLKDADSFEVAMNKINKLITDSPDIKAWASFGQYDKNKVEAQCREYAIKSELSNLRHFNVKNLCWAQSALPKAYGLANALESRGLTLEGKHHSGVDDAYNIAKLVDYLLNTVY